MTRADVVVHRRSLTVSTLEARARGELVQALVIARLRDAVSGAAATGPTRVVGSLPGLSRRVAGDGYAGLVGRPTRVLPGLAGQPETMDVTFSVEGFAPRVETVTFAQDPTFPGTFAVADLGELDLHRDPVRLEVKTDELDAANNPVPLPGAVVVVDEASDRIDQPVAPAPVLGVRVGLSRPRPTGSSVRSTSLTMPAEPERRLAIGSAPGADVIEVDNRGGLLVGDLVGIDLTVPERAEWIEVTGITGPVDPLAAATVRLRHPLVHGHAGGDLVRRIVVSGPGGTLSTLTRSALAGDRTLRVNSLTAVGTGQVVQVVGGVSSPEYRAVALYRGTTNTDGIAVLPPISGLAALGVTATSGGMTASATVSLTPPSPVRRLELTLS